MSSREDTVRKHVSSALDESSRANFEAALKSHSLTFYQKGRSPAVNLKTNSGGQRFRLQRLGLLDRWNAALAAWGEDANYPSRGTVRTRGKGVDEIAALWHEFSNNSSKLSPNERLSVRDFLEELSYDDVCKALEITASRLSGKPDEDRFRYFCGICWNKIKELKSSRAD